MIRRPPRSTLSSSSAASDVYKRQFTYRVSNRVITSCRSCRDGQFTRCIYCRTNRVIIYGNRDVVIIHRLSVQKIIGGQLSGNTTLVAINRCLLYTSDAADEEDSVDLG